MKEAIHIRKNKTVDKLRQGVLSTYSYPWQLTACHSAI